jgi:Protein kinase domain
LSSQDRWKIVEEMFHAALDRPAHERSAYLDSACAGDGELRRDVESLLREWGESKSFMEAPAGGLSIAPMDFPSLEGRTLNHYQIGPLVGSGGMAEVYRARDTKLGRDVAVKILHVRFIDRGILDPIYREARVLASLNQPNIAAIYGVEEAEGLCGLILELVEGETLADRIQRGPLSAGEAIGIARQIAAGLKAAHAKGVIHRDLKPSNIKVTPEDSVKLLDFGLAKLLQSLNIDETIADISRQGVVMGTIAYMSPEQARGKPVDARTDVWAFGCVLYEMLVGRAAFRGDSPTDIIVKIAMEEPDWIAIPKPSDGLSFELEQLIRKCIQKDPDSRFASVREIAQALAALEQGTRGPSSGTKMRPAVDEKEFALPAGIAFSLFMFAQFGYLALYGAAMYHIDAVSEILVRDFQMPATASIVGTLLLAMFGIAVRLYLISAVGWRHPAAGRKFTLLFPVLLVLDGIWAASPLLLWRTPIGFGVAFVGVALLAYVPFAQRTLMRAIYPGGHKP